MCSRVLIGEYKTEGLSRSPRGETKVSKGGGNPGALLPVVTDSLPSKVQEFRWGLLRDRDNEIHTNCKHARLDSLFHKPTFKDLVGRRHCVTRIQGFFEYNPEDEVQYYISRADGAPLYIAGIWDIWMDVDTNILIPTFAMITTDPNEDMMHVHNRMPVIIERNDIRTWLNPALSGEQRVSLLKRTEAGILKAIPAKGHEVQKAPEAPRKPPANGLFG